MKIEQFTRHTARSGFETLDPAQLGGLNDEQRDHVVRTTLALGPSLIQSGHTERAAGRAVVGGALAAAAAVVFMLQSRQIETRTLLPAPPASWESDTQPTPAFEEDLGRSSIQAGPRIRAVTPGGGNAWTDSPHGRVHTTGTVMRIASLASTTSISVVEGEVVMRTLEGAERVGAGHTVTVGRAGIERHALSGQDPKNVTGTVDTSPNAVQEPVHDSGAKPKPATRAHRRPLMPRATAKRASQVPAATLLTQAETLWQKGDRDAARLAFRAAAHDSGPIGEAAWVRLARLELSSGSSEQALQALKARKGRADSGTLGAEALWLEAQALGRAGRRIEAVKAAEKLLRDYSSAPQAPAARGLIVKSKIP